MSLCKRALDKNLRKLEFTGAPCAKKQVPKKRDSVRRS